MILYQLLFLLQLLSVSGASESSIVGGKESKPHSRPYMVSLQIDGRHVCGGLLIRKDFVLTSAHCGGSGNLMVVLGAHHINKEEKSQQRIPVADYHAHPKYTNTYDYDVMLLKLETNAVLDRSVKTIGLPKKNGQIPANIKCIVAGWGMTAPQMNSSNVLREATVLTQFNFECKNIWSKNFYGDHMICTHSAKKKAGICQGDSGGPLICNGKPQGITSYHKVNDCDNPKYPHVFMKIAFFAPWIRSVMEGKERVAQVTAEEG